MTRVHSCIWLVSRLMCCLGSLVYPGPVNAAGTDVVFPAAEPGRTLQFPRDHGAHPDFRTEWWYVTGWVESRNIQRGFQVTFFRVRTGLQEDSESGFAPKQLIFAHAAIADAGHGLLRHDQRAAREGFGLAEARTDDTGVQVDGWTLLREDGEYRTRVEARDFGIDLTLVPTQSVLLQGQSGYSRKGGQTGQASYYYSVPQLEVSGSIEIENEVTPVNGAAWLDHEWSSEYLPVEAQGWDWIGINLVDGGALMAFRMRAHDGTTLWAGGSHRNAAGERRVFSPDEVTFDALEQWRSPRTRADYPVSMRVHAGERVIELVPLMVDQELDSAASTGIVYWEGAVKALSGGKLVGRGYMELTGYAGRPEM